MGNLQLTLAEYIPQNKDTWHRLAKRDKLDESALDYATWDFIGQFRFYLLIKIPKTFFIRFCSWSSI